MKKLLSLACAVVVIGGVASAVGPTAAYADSSTTYGVSGTYTYNVPSDAVAVQVVVAASGGSYVNSGAGFVTGVPGGGAELSGVLPVTPGTELTVDVGGFGVNGAYYPGGDDGIQYVGGYGMAAGPGGGGASDIRGWIIAGGGGAAGGGANGAVGGNGGNGGLLGEPGTGGSACAVGSGGGGGGSAAAGGPSGAGCGGSAGIAGAPGSGGTGGDTGSVGVTALGGGGGGGGGYFGGGGGGGGGAAGASPLSSGGGGGGSSWAATTVVDTSLVGLNHSSGFVTITPLSVGAVQQLPADAGASSACAAKGGTVVTDTTNEGLRTSVYTYVQPGSPSTETDVCFRIDYNGTGVGGMFSITPTQPGISVTGTPPMITVPQIGTPSVDTNASYCTHPPAGSAVNQVPGQHPASTGILPGGSTWMIDAYSDGTSVVWACVQLGAVNTRIVIPVAIPSTTPPTVGIPSVGVSPGYDVTFSPDPGTP